MNIFCVHNTMGRVISCIFRSWVRRWMGLKNRRSIEGTGHRGQNIIPLQLKVINWIRQKSVFSFWTTGLEWSLKSCHVTWLCALVSGRAKGASLWVWWIKTWKNCNQPSMHNRTPAIQTFAFICKFFFLLPNIAHFATKFEKPLLSIFLWTLGLDFCVAAHTSSVSCWFVHTFLCSRKAGLSGHGLAFKY